MDSKSLTFCMRGELDKIWFTEIDFDLTVYVKKDSEHKNKRSRDQNDL